MGVIKSFIWAFLEQAGAKVVTLVVQIVLARLLAPEEFGVLAILLVIVSIADAIAQSGLGAALIQDANANDKSYTTCFWMSFGFAILFFAALLLLAPLVSWFYAIDSLALYLRVIGIMIPLNAANSIFRSYLQKKMDFKSLFKVSFFSAIGSGVTGIVGALLGFGIWALILQVIAQSFLALVMSVWYVSWYPSLFFDWKVARRLFGYGWKVCVTGILNVLYNGISELVIGKTCSPTSLGYYTQGRKYPNTAISIISNALQNVMFPAFAKLQEDKQRLREAIRRALTVGTFVIVPVSFVFTITAPSIVDILLTEKWSSCVPVFQLVCFSNCVIMLQLSNLRGYMAVGESGLYLRLQVIKVIVGTVLICMVAIMTQDIYWVAFATCIFCFMAVLIIDMQPAGRVLGYKRSQQLKDVLPTYVIALFAAFPAWALSFLAAPDWFMLCSQIVAYAIAYIGIARLTRNSAFKELIMVLRSLKLSAKGD